VGAAVTFAVIAAILALAGPPSVWTALALLSLFPLDRDRNGRDRKETALAINLLRDTGVPLREQRFSWRELVQSPYNKLRDDAFTRVRVILMNGIESEALRFSHACARMNGPLQAALAQVRRVEQHQQTLVNWLNPADQNPLETTISPSFPPERRCSSITACS